MIETKISVSQKDATFIQSLAGQKILVLFTSAQAVDAVKNCFTNTVTDWQICCISGATRKAVISFFGEDKILASANDAVDLLKEMESLAPCKTVFFCGNKRLDTLPEKLTARGFQLTEIEVYETKLTAPKLQEDYDGILFFSPSGVESYLMENIIPAEAILFSIGKTTAGFLANQVNNEIIIAAQPDKNILVQTLIEYYKNKAK